MIPLDQSPVSAMADAVRLQLSPWEELLWILAPFMLAILILVFVDRWILSLRRSLKRRREAREQPGSSPLHPLHVTSLEQVLQRTARRCTCGALPKVVYEGSTTSQQRKLRLMIEMCPECESRVRTYYDITEVRDALPINSPPPITPAPR